ncbi:hypothetical protein T484DRAFT_1789694, partial [Baffinella frigidus]
MHAATAAALLLAPPAGLLANIAAVAATLREKHAHSFQPPLAAVGAWVALTVQLYNLRAGGAEEGAEEWEAEEEGREIEEGEEEGRAARSIAGLVVESVACWTAVAAASPNQRKSVACWTAVAAASSNQHKVFTAAVDDLLPAAAALSAPLPRAPPLAILLTPPTSSR